jgi:hypothetical protein
VFLRYFLSLIIAQVGIVGLSGVVDVVTPADDVAGGDRPANVVADYAPLRVVGINRTGPYNPVIEDQLRWLIVGVWGVIGCGGLLASRRDACAVGVPSTAATSSVASATSTRLPLTLIGSFLR